MNTTYQKWKAIQLEILFTISCRPPNISQAAAVEQVVEQELDNQFSREPTVAGAIYEVVHKEFIKLEAYWLRKEEEEEISISNSILCTLGVKNQNMKMIFDISTLGIGSSNEH